MIGYNLVGVGATRTVVLSDWLMDTSSWDGAHAYLDQATLTWAFADLRGYGRSRNQRGDYTVEEGAHDVLELADSLGWGRFVVVGHSMSCLVALHLGQRWPDRVDRVVAVTPPPPRGLAYDDTTFTALQAVARADDARRSTALRALLGNALSDGWIRYVLARWRAGAEDDAVAGYVSMFGRRGLPDLSTPVSVPVLAITGEEDAEIMRSAAVSRALAPLCKHFQVVAFAACGHYPMLEAPPRLVTALERFVAP
jgi:pimeloyl-ACP methyl ester carboxylesterase